jgi:serine/threonine protein kinase
MVADNSAGKQFRCPSCQKPFTVPADTAPALAAVGAGAARGSPSWPGAPPRPAPEECPVCKSPLQPGAVTCLECGYLVQAEAAGEAEEVVALNLCPNPNCRVANPPGEPNCQRCGEVLPRAPGTMMHGRYRVERLLAMGGFGAVYLATDTVQHNRAVAVKDMICADPQEFAIRLNFFRREAAILRSLEKSFSTVPRVYDLIEQGQSAHLVLEFIRGTDLLKLMEGNHNKPYPLEQIIEWAKIICDVLQHMHTQTPPLVHRDLKPDNIMLLEDRRTIKMIDFGTARDLGRTGKTRMKGKTRVFTEGYAPPEQIAGKPEPRSDLFALAATLYHLATGKAPVSSLSEYPPPTRQELETQLAAPNGGIPADQRWFFELIKTNLAEDINDRYFSAREIKADLEKRRVTREVACPKCQTTNKVRAPYCTRCAEPLTELAQPCHHCGKNNRMGCPCCIHCGNRLR